MTYVFIKTPTQLRESCGNFFLCNSIDLTNCTFIRFRTNSNLKLGKRTVLLHYNIIKFDSVLIVLFIIIYTCCTGLDSDANSNQNEKQGRESWGQKIIFSIEIFSSPNDNCKLSKIDFDCS